MNRKWINCKVSENAHETLAQLASDRGLHTSDVAADLLEEALAEKGWEDDASPKARLFALAHRADEDEVMRQQLERVAWLAINKSDEALADELVRLCGETGYSADEIMERASKFKQAPIVISRNGTGKDSAKRWLQDRFTEQEEWPVQEIRDRLGGEAGFSKVTLNRAKRELGVISERRSTHWIWAMPEEGRQQQHHPYM